MSENDYANDPASAWKKQAAGSAPAKPREYTFDELRNRNAPVTLSAREYERLTAIEKAAKNIVGYSFLKAP